MKRHTMSWQDATLALTYPAVLGAIIYTFLNTAVQAGAVPVLTFLLADGRSPMKPAPSQTPFLAAFHLNRSFTATAFILLTAAIIIHFSADFLYSKYSEESYSWVNFIFDALITVLVALSYIAMSTWARQPGSQAKVAFFIFWAAFFLIYLLFIFWDILEYRDSRSSGTVKTSFYAGMIWPFETSALAAWALLAIGSFFMGTRTWYDYAYVSAGAFTLCLYAVWLWMKMRILEGTAAPGQDRSQSAVSGLEEVLAIRRADSGDIARCAQIFVDAYQETYEETWSFKAAQLRLVEILNVDRKYCHVLVVGGTVQGFLFARPFNWSDGKRLWIEEVVVAKDFHGMGYGTLLLRTLDRIAGQDGIVGYSLIAQRDSDARALYARLGYVESDWLHFERNRQLLQLEKSNRRVLSVCETDCSDSGSFQVSLTASLFHGNKETLTNHLQIGRPSERSPLAASFTCVCAWSTQYTTSDSIVRDRVLLRKPAGTVSCFP